MLNKFYRLYPYLGIEKIENPELKDIIPNADIKVTEVYSFDIEESDDGIFKLGKVDLYEYSNEINKKRFCYIIRNASSNIKFPSLMVKPKELDKSKRALMSYFRNAETLNDDNLKRLGEFIGENIDTIFETFIDNSKNFIFSISINGESIYSHPYFKPSRDNFIKDTTNHECMLENKVYKQCHLCKKVKTIGNFNFEKMKFYAYIKYPSVNFGLKRRHDIQNKICGDCFGKLRDVYDIINDETRYNFIHNFLGFKYMILPEFIVDSEENEEIMRYFLEKDYIINKFHSNYKRLNSNNERELLYAIREEKLKVNYHMFFFEASQSQFQIFDSIYGIYPKMFAKIFDTKAEVDAMGFKFKEGKDEIIKEIDMFDIIKLLENICNRRAINVIVNIFKGSSIDSKWFKNEIIKTLDKLFKNNKNISYMTNLAMMWLIWFNKMGILQNRKEVIKMTEKLNTVLEEYQDETTEQFIDSNDLRMAFLMGVLYEHLRMIQYSNLNNTPFDKKVGNLKFTYEKLKKLYVEMELKLMQYKVNSRFVKLLTHDITTYLKSFKEASAENEDLSLAFIIGKRSYEEIKEVYENKIKEVKENDEE